MHDSGKKNDLTKRLILGLFPDRNADGTIKEGWVATQPQEFALIELMQITGNFDYWMWMRNPREINELIKIYLATKAQIDSTLN